MITADTLRRFAHRIQDPDLHAQALESARIKSTVTTARRLAHFMGQIYIETKGLTRLVENLNYRDPQRLDELFSAVHGIDDSKALIQRGPEAIANRVYANRLGNRNEASGDGWRYRGSGYQQLTGRSNYRVIGRHVGLDLENHPDLAREPIHAAYIAFAFWDSQALSEFADRGDVKEITRRINGPALLGLDERQDATARALQIWTD